MPDLIKKYYEKFNILFTNGFREVQGDMNLRTADIDEKIFTVAGAHNCGGRCMSRVHVRNGVIVRIITDPAEDTPENPALKSCLRCRSYRTRHYHPDRLKYPMKRTGKRGQGQFKRISWEEATNYIAGEIRRIADIYGPDSLYVNYATGNAVLYPG